MPIPAVFLDRDGTLNRQIVRGGKPYPPNTIEEFTLFDDAAESCLLLKRAGFALVVATNQPDVGRGTQRREVVEAMHHQLRIWIPEIDRIEVCFDPGRGEPSARRKPAPGMLLEAAEALQIDLSRSWMIGDRWRDVDCGKRAGVRTVLIDFGYQEDLREAPDHVVRTLGEAVRVVLSHPSTST
jgi:D-glycero-D-manno-heptose 1,7-bisphosphate phosphatase